jgi:single-strand DNA-binding protein
MLNKVMLIGRLGRDPEIKYTSAGTPITNLSMATDESYIDHDGNKVERTEWHTVVVFQRQAENCKTYLAKGSLVFVEGSLQTNKWQDQNGQDRYRTVIKAIFVKFLGRRRDQEQQQMQQPAHQQQRQREPYSDDDFAPAFPSEASGMDDVPF